MAARQSVRQQIIIMRKEERIWGRPRRMEVAIGPGRGVSSGRIGGILRGGPTELAECAGGEEVGYGFFKVVCWANGLAIAD
jgi:hypothetical protein